MKEDDKPAIGNRSNPPAARQFDIWAPLPRTQDRERTSPRPLSVILEPAAEFQFKSFRSQWRRSAERALHKLAENPFNSTEMHGPHALLGERRAKFFGVHVFFRLSGRGIVVFSISPDTIDDDDDESIIPNIPLEFLSFTPTALAAPNLPCTFGINAGISCLARLPSLCGEINAQLHHDAGELLSGGTLERLLETRVHDATAHNVRSGRWSIDIVDDAAARAAFGRGRRIASNTGWSSPLLQIALSHHEEAYARITGRVFDAIASAAEWEPLQAFASVGRTSGETNGASSSFQSELRILFAYYLLVFDNSRLCVGVHARTIESKSVEAAWLTPFSFLPSYDFKLVRGLSNTTFGADADKYNARNFAHWPSLPSFRSTMLLPQAPSRRVTGTSKFFVRRLIGLGRHLIC